MCEKFYNSTELIDDIALFWHPQRPKPQQTVVVSGCVLTAPTMHSLSYPMIVLKSTVDSGYRGMLYRGKSGYRGQFAADQNFYLVKAGQIEEKGAF